MKAVNKSKNIFLNFLLAVALITGIANFIIILLYKNDQYLLINTISNFLLCIFIIFFIFSTITNTKKKKTTIFIATIAIILFNGFEIANHLDLINILKINEVPNFTNKNLVEVIKWSKKNNIKVNQIYEYSDTIEEYNIINQNHSNTLLKNIKEITISVSEGPNPEKEVVIPDMNTWDADKVLEYINNNHLNNVNVDFIVSDKDKDTVIEQSKSGSMKRSEELKLTFSLGEEDSLEEIKLIDLKNKSQFEAEFFLKRHAIKYDIEKDFSNKIKRNNIIKTNKSIGTKLKPNSDKDKLKLIVSKGKKIKVPDLKKYDILKITEWIISNKLKLEFKEIYDDSIKKNKIIDVNYNKDDIIEEKTLIKVTISKGKLVMISFDTIDDFKQWANKYNVNYEEKFEFSSEIEEGKVISYSHKVGDTIKNNDIITITISQGNKTKVPNIIGNTKKEAMKKLENAKLKYNFVYENSTKEKNIVLKQSLSSGSEVAENSTITITLSNGKKPSAGNTKNNTNTSSNSNNNSSGNSGSSTPTTPSCDTSIGQVIYIMPEHISSDPGTTCSKIKSAYPKVKFSCQYVSSGPGKGLLVNSNEVDGIFHNYCNTYVLKIQS